MVYGDAKVTTVRDLVGVVTAAQAGDDEALTELVSAHLPLVYSVVRRTLPWHADVDDVVQDTMISVIRGLPGLREPGKFSLWLMAITHQQVRSYLRDRRTRLNHLDEFPAEEATASADFSDQAVRELVHDQQRRELTEAAGWLDEGDRRLLALWWQENVGQLNRTEVAAGLMLTPKHAGTRLRRMKAQLQAVRVVVRALHVSPRCPRLTTLVHGWDGVPGPVWRKRLVRHVRNCEHCSRYERGLVPPERLLLGITSLPVAGLAAQTPAAGVLSSIWSSVRNFFSTKMAAATAAVTVAAGGGFAYAVYETPTTGDGSRGIAQAPNVTGISPTVTPASSPVSSPSASRSAAATTGVTVADIYVAPDGSDTGTGKVSNPFATLEKAIAVVRPGQTIALRGGVYRPAGPAVITASGTADKRITLSNFRSERPVIDASRVPADKFMITNEAGYWTVQGLEIKNSRSHAYVCISCRFNVMQRLSIHDNARSALTLTGAGTIGNQILNNDFFNNHDPDEAGNAGVGLAVKDGSGEGNVVRGNRAFNNGDNGFDLGGFAGPITLERNWAYGNGVNRWGVQGWRSNADGFHLGGGNPAPAAAHVLRDNAAWDNVSSGFSGSGNSGAMYLAHNTAYRNGDDGFHLPDATGGTVQDNAAADNGDAAAVVGAGAAMRGNTWQGTTSSFRSTDPTAAQGTRAADGTLPSVDFLATSTGVGAAMTG